MPTRPWIMFDHHSRGTDVRGVEVVWGDLAEESGLVTSKRRTLLDCARRLPFEVALCVADSALRHGVDHETFLRDASAARGKGSPQAREIARFATAASANVFESMLRALALRAGLDVAAQVPVRLRGRAGDADVEVHPDVGDVSRRLALEADSWEFHTSKTAFQSDCWRYAMLVLEGWTVLRFTWWQVMHHPDWVVACLVEVRDRLVRAA